MNIYEKLHKIQKDLKAPKGQFNNFGKYKYRSCEDIVEAVKPLLEGCVLLLSDDVLMQDNRHYIKATASLADVDGKGVVSVTALAREPENKKGMDESQITGAASSYARKYALNGLFGIDDTKDADTEKPQDGGKSETKSEVETENDSKVEARKLELIEEIKKRILDDVNGDMVGAQEVLASATKNKAKSTKTLEKWTFAQVKEVHTKICTPVL